MAARKKVTTVRKSSPQKAVAKKTPRTTTRKSVAEKSLVVTSMQNQYVKNPRLWVGLGVVVLVVLAFLYKGLFVAALVNGQPISRLSVVSSLEKQNGKQALNNLVVETLVKQEAQKRNVTVSQSEIDSEVKKIEDQLKTQGVTLDSALSARGMSKTDLTEQITLQKLLDKMVGTSVKVTDDDVQAYIDKNQDTLPQDLSADDLKAQVRTQLEQQQVQEKTQAFVSDLQKKAKITLFVNY